VTYRIIEKDKKGKEKDKGWTCDLVPKSLIVSRYFTKEHEAISKLEAELEGVAARISELEEEHGGEEGIFSSFDKVNKASVTDRMNELLGEQKTQKRHAKILDTEDMLMMVAEDPASYGRKNASEEDILHTWLELNNRETQLKKALKDAEVELDAKACAQYPKLSEDEIKTLVVDDKWLAALDTAIHGEMDRISQALTRRVKELAERYETPLPEQIRKVAELEKKVNRHLERMGFSWK
jgi:type I restriction enzyme M protein